MTNKSKLVALLLSLCIGLHGCIIIPTGEDKVLDGNPVSEEHISFIQSGVTMKAEVLQRLGQPSLIWENEQLFAYDWEMRQGILFWATPGTYPSATGAFNLGKHYVLLIQFDQEDCVMRFEKTTRPSNEKYGEFLAKWVERSDTNSTKEDITQEVK